MATYKCERIHGATCRYLSQSSIQNLLRQFIPARSVNSVVIQELTCSAVNMLAYGSEVESSLHRRSQTVIDSCFTILCLYYCFMVWGFYLTKSIYSKTVNSLKHLTLHLKAQLKIKISRFDRGNIA